MVRLFLQVYLQRLNICPTRENLFWPANTGTGRVDISLVEDGMPANFQHTFHNSILQR